jgi:hypothetical protein
MSLSAPAHGLQGGLATLACAYPYHIVYREDKYFAIAEFAGPSGSHDGLHDRFFYLIWNNHFDFNLRDEFNLVLRAAIRFGMPALTPVTANLADSHPGNVNIPESVPHRVQEVRPDDRFDLFHLLFSFV